MDTFNTVKQYLFSRWSKLPSYQKFAVSIGGLWLLREFYLNATRKDLTDQVAVITGGGSGIGRLTALRLSKEGCKIVLWDVDEKGLQKVSEEIRRTGDKHASECRAYRVDVTDRKLVYDIARQVISELGRVDILINNAGIVSGKKILENNDDRMALTIAINTTSHLWTIKAFLPGMLSRNVGHVVSLASAAGTVGVAGLIDYCASKYGAVGINDSLRAELYKLGSNINTLCVCPFYIKTDMFKGVKTRDPFLLPLLEPEYVADCIVRAMKRRQAYLMLPRFVYVSSALVRLLPCSVMDFLSQKMGINDTMDTFQGKH